MRLGASSLNVVTGISGGGMAGGLSASLPLAVTLGADLYVPMHMLNGMWVEAPDGVNETRVAAATNAVGQIDLQGAYSGRCIATNAAARGALGTTTRNGYVTVSQSHVYSVERSTKLLRYMHVEKVFTFIAYIKKGDDGATRVIWDQIDGSAATDTNTAAGWRIQCTSANLIQAFVANGAGSLMANVSTTAKTVTAADGWVMVVVQCNGHGAGLCKIRAYSCATGAQLWAETTGTSAAATAAAAGTNSTKSIGLGANSDGTSSTTRFIGDLGGYAVFPTILSDANLTALALDNPALTTSNPARALTVGSALSPIQLSHCQYWFDFRTAGTWNFQERTSPTTPAADGQPLGYSFNRAGENLNRDLTAQSDGERPNWTDDQFGASQGAINFEGSDAERVDFAAWQKAGNWSFLIVGRQNDLANGSQVLRSGSSTIYMTQVCTNYEGNGDCYFILHDPVSFYGRENEVGTAIQGEVLHAWMGRLHASTATIGVGGLWGTPITTATSVHNMDRMGASASHDADFDPDMEIVAVCAWNALHSEANLRKVMQYFIDGGLAITELD